MTNIPDQVVHYYLPDKKPFLNLSDISEEERKPILEDLEKRRLAGKMKRGFPDWYFPQRQEAEKNLMKAYLEKGGKPERQAPHFFSLGRSKGIEFGYGNNFKTIIIPIELIKHEAYFSIGDTLWTFSKSYAPDIIYENNWFQGKIYTYDETVEILKELALDVEDNASLGKHKVSCVEALLWSDSILKLLSAEGHISM